MPHTQNTKPKSDSTNPNSKRENTLKLYGYIRQEYTRMRGVKRDGKALFSQEYILHEVAKKFCKSPKTIENIVFNRV